MNSEDETTAVDNDRPSGQIAIVVVTWNCRADLEQTVLSVLALQDPRVTLYIVDGGSSDGTVDYLQTLQGAPVVWVSEPDRGIYDAMNKGWHMVPADYYVLYMGSGDKPITLPSPADLAAAAARGIRIVLGLCDYGRDAPFESAWNSDLRYRNTAHHQALMIHKSLSPKPPFDTTFKVYGDWEFSLRLFKAGHAAWFDAGFRSYALPGGVSANIDLWEVWKVSYPHAGLVDGLRAVRRNLRARRMLARQARLAASA